MSDKKKKVENKVTDGEETWEDGKKDGVTKTPRSIDTYKKELAEKVFDFMEYETKRGRHIGHPEEVLEKYYDAFAKFLGSDKLLKDIEQYLGGKGKLTYEVIKDVKMSGGMLFDQAWRNRMLDTLEEKECQTYYELMVNNYGTWFAKHGLEGDWKDFLNNHTPKLALTAEQFVSQDISVQKKQKGQISRTGDNLHDLVKAFQDFSIKQKLSEKQQQAIVNWATISNATLVGALRGKGYYSPEMQQLIDGKITFNKKLQRTSKKDLDKEVAEVTRFWKLQSFVVRSDIEDTAYRVLDELKPRVLATQALLKHQGFKRSILSNYPIDDFAKKTHRTLDALGKEQYSSAPQWKIIELTSDQPGAGEKWRREKLAELEEMKAQLKIEPDIATRDLLKHVIKDLEEATRDDGIVVVDTNSIIQHQEFINDYLWWVSKQTDGDKATKAYVHYLQEHNQSLSALEGKVTADGSIGNIKATKAIMQYGLQQNIEKHIKALPGLVDIVKEKHGIDLRSPEYIQFWLDVYDPEKLEVTLPAKNPSKSIQLYFKRKGIRSNVLSVHDMLFPKKGAEEHEETDLFDMILELDIDKTAIEEAERLMAEVDGKGDRIGKFKVLGSHGRPIRLQTETIYFLQERKNKADVGEYIYARIPTDEHSTTMEHVFIPAKLYVAYQEDDGSMLPQDLLAHQDVRVMNTEQMQEYIFTRKHGVQLSWNHIALFNSLYGENTTPWKSTYDWSWPQTKSYLDDLLKNDQWEALASRVSTWPSWSGEHKDNLDWFFAHVGFTDTVPSQKEIQKTFTYRSNGELLSRVQEGKIMFNAKRLEKDFGFKFQRKGGLIQHPLQFKPTTDDTYDWRGFRQMFGQYIWDFPQKEWRFDKTAAERDGSDRNPAYKNAEGQHFQEFLQAMFNHEKTHRFWNFMGWVRLYWTNKILH